MADAGEVVSVHSAEIFDALGKLRTGLTSAADAPGMIVVPETLHGGADESISLVTNMVLLFGAAISAQFEIIAATTDTITAGAVLADESVNVGSTGDGAG